ncbi:MAG: hypothetical protein F6K40_15940 [Okeania sp. SIO3I5]|uniref:hypothetical protein n=1 Tax=Okeania sp. SIO3I5 TaxID=2607805 RepID=UPI0013B679A2|nr:hypothetical protein [Okeania sp. SIO3I5]NEQ37674.1 hypothetical protein [Okeania sp. SIO3I5]
MYTKKWVLETTRYLCDLGFFEDYCNLPDEELIEIIIFLRRTSPEKRDYYSSLAPDRLLSLDEVNYQAPIDPSTDNKLFDEEKDYQILELDTKRVICGYTDHLYGDDWPPYKFEDFVKLLEELSKISRGNFIPNEIVESGEEQISFKLKYCNFVPVYCSFVPNGPPDDPFILAGDINPTLLGTGYQFEYLDCGDPILLMLLSEDEKRKLIQDRGWKFLPDYWMFDPTEISPYMQLRRNLQLHPIE